MTTTYRISRFETSNAQYAEFLNAKAATDSFALYNTNMGSGFGGIVRSGSAGGYTYNAIAGRGNMPVNFVSFYDSIRFANWLHNGQGSGDTETGAYTLLGGTAIPSNGLTVTRNAGATVFLTSEDEWYKAAYFDGTSYFDYPTGFDAQTSCSSLPVSPWVPATNKANCSNAVGDVADVGSYTDSASPYGTFDQGGNAGEWNDTIITGSRRGLRGGAFHVDPLFFLAAVQLHSPPSSETFDVGFRVASLVPEPGTALLLAAATLGLARWRRRLRD